MGMSAGRCAKCKKVVAQESEASGKGFNLGKRAHLVGRSEHGPRGDLPVRERRDLRNHVLLCVVVTTRSDLDEEARPIERLRELRESHLAWVGQLDYGGQVDHERLICQRAMCPARNIETQSSRS
jgi:hypothetical protein